MATTANEGLACRGTETLREAITAAAAIGFLAGGGTRVIANVGDLPSLLTAALYLPLGAIAAAVLAGVRDEPDRPSRPGHGPHATTDYLLSPIRWQEHCRALQPSHGGVRPVRPRGRMSDR